MLVGNALLGGGLRSLVLTKGKDTKEGERSICIKSTKATQQAIAGHKGEKGGG